MDRITEGLLKRLEKQRVEIAIALCQTPVDTFDKYRERVGRFAQIGEDIAEIKQAHRATEE